MEGGEISSLTLTLKYEFILLSYFVPKHLLYVTSLHKFGMDVEVAGGDISSRG